MAEALPVLFENGRGGLWIQFAASRRQQVAKLPASLTLDAQESPGNKLAVIGDPDRAFKQFLQLGRVRAGLGQEAGGGGVTAKKCLEWIHRLTLALPRR